MKRKRKKNIKNTKVSEDQAHTPALFRGFFSGRQEREFSFASCILEPYLDNLEQLMDMTCCDIQFNWPYFNITLFCLPLRSHT